MKRLLLLVLLCLSSIVNCQDLLEVTRRNIFDTIRDNSPIVILFLDDGQDSAVMKKSFEDSKEYMLSMAPPVKIGVFQVTPEHKVPQDFLVYRFPGVLLFTGLEIPKMYVGGANSGEISEWLSLILEGSIDHSKELNSVQDYLFQKKENSLIMIFFGEELEKNPDFSLYLNVVKKAKAKHQDIVFCHSKDKGLKQHLKVKNTPMILFFNEREQVKYEFKGKLEFFELNKFIDYSKISKFFQFDREELEKQEAAQNNILVLFLDLEEDESKKLVETMKATKEYFLANNINIGVADPYDWNDNTFLQKFNLTNDMLPQLIYLNQENLVVSYNPKKYRFNLAYPNQSITKESIIQFYEDATQQKIPQFYNSEYMDDEERELNDELFVKKIVADNYQEFSQPGENYSLILYLKDGCYECGKARKLWLEVIKYFRKASNIKFGIINLSKNDRPDIKVRPPFCLLFHQDEKQQMNLSDMNTPMELKTWIESNSKIIKQNEQQYDVKSKQAKVSDQDKIEL